MQAFCNILKYLLYVKEKWPEEECASEIYSSMVSTILSSGVVVLSKGLIHLIVLIVHGNGEQIAE